MNINLITVVAMMIVKLLRLHGLAGKARTVWNEVQKELNRQPVDYWPVEGR